MVEAAIDSDETGSTEALDRLGQNQSEHDALVHRNPPQPPTTGNTTTTTPPPVDRVQPSRVVHTAGGGQATVSVESVDGEQWLTVTDAQGHVTFSGRREGPGPVTGTSFDGSAGAGGGTTATMTINNQGVMTVTPESRTR